MRPLRLVWIGGMFLVGCLIPSVEELAGGGGSKGTDASVQTNEIEAGATDGATGADAPASDSTTTPDAGSCVGAVLCDDFERTSGVGPWSALDTALGGTSDYVAGRDGKAFRYFYDGVDSGTGEGPHAALARNDVAGATRRVAFDFSKDVGPGFFNAAGIYVSFGKKNVSAVYQVNQNGGALAIQVWNFETNTEVYYHGTSFPAGTPPSKVWGRGQLEIAIVGTKATAKAWYEGALVATETADGIANGLADISVGCLYSNFVRGSGSILIDNVRVDSIP